MHPNRSKPITKTEFHPPVENWASTPNRKTRSGPSPHDGTPPPQRLAFATISNLINGGSSIQLRVDELVSSLRLDAALHTLDIVTSPKGEGGEKVLNEDEQRFQDLFVPSPLGDVFMPKFYAAAVGLFRGLYGRRCLSNDPVQQRIRSSSNEPGLPRSRGPGAFDKVTSMKQPAATEVRCGIELSPCSAACPSTPPSGPISVLGSSAAARRHLCRLASRRSSSGGLDYAAAGVNFSISLLSMLPTAVRWRLVVEEQFTSP
ncbi:hypothetical protein THAOC_04068 [Thalassiosira oceanica]|uniref:Uncharacterized protein n=1 Tax=Thalassiosira oceanica TaxID=159749 RepID=K0TK10_THAOC|nr:hypothetical protein THAOC_04068 [Thalassiosira oceanica]|eukprot:EJK74266.1 hypothetical protein THAOC_04068 [Thalassiosira oceanica]